MNNNIVLEMKNITKRFPGVIALKNVSMDLHRGEILAICGENGAGKSTLMKILNGNYSSKDYEGEIYLDGKLVDLGSVKMAKHLGIEMVYQELNAIMEASLAENLFVGNLPGKKGLVNYKTLYERSSEVLQEVGIRVDPREKARNLGSGQLQMLAIMRAMQTSPRILVLDEPTSALADKEVDQLLSFLDTLRKKGVSCVFVNHRLDEVFRIADRVVVLRDGEEVLTQSIQEMTKDQLVEAMVGRKIEMLYPSSEVEIGDEILRVEGLTIPDSTMPGRDIVKNISFALRKGEILGIGGLVGSGRSEILGAIFGRLTEGVKKSVYLNGKECVINSPNDALMARIGFVTEERKLSGIVEVFNIRQNLTLSNLRNIPGKYFIDQNKEKELSLATFDRLRIKAPSLETGITALSGGNQQKVVLGKSLLPDPQILLLDEPTKGVDVGTKAELYLIMRELAARGVSIIMVSSDMPELVSMSDRCIVVSGGRITGEFTGEDISQRNVMRAAIA